MQETTLKIGMIEDNEVLSENTAAYLELKGIQTDIYESTEDFEQKNTDVSVYHLILLDINLPGSSGVEYLQHLRARGDYIPVILLTSMNTSTDIVHGLEVGADDYVSKPFNFEELVARIKMVVARKGAVAPQDLTQIILKDGSSIEIDRSYKKVRKNSENIYLPTLEYQLLDYFLKNRGKILSRDELYEQVWGEFDKYQLSRSVDVYVGYLRKKLGKDIIITKKGDGYYLP
ncbi:response regulator transcription factor [Candidatus Gracilibacteria bacterium]|nr:response regulator transcription factor [Candidatus Gracilibacteria bacterium]